MSSKARGPECLGRCDAEVSRARAVGKVLSSVLLLSQGSGVCHKYNHPVLKAQYSRPSLGGSM